MSMTSGAARYVVHHETRYAYTAPVSQSWQLARLTPRVLPWQTLLSYSLEIEPRADERRDELDSFGNRVTHFGLHGAHRMLRVRMECLVEVTARPRAESPEAEPPLAWEAVREAIRRDPQQDDLVPRRWCRSRTARAATPAIRLRAAGPGSRR
jgi:transglutaminase-like putative cysteine protease